MIRHFGNVPVYRESTTTTTTTILLAKEIYNHVDNNVYMMAGCQVGRSPRVLAAHKALSTLSQKTATVAENGDG